ncbi:hypothetical protein NE236_20860 [Actinoallomurus purpureus]|uniref:hypothetical protein n=1 Tax=Actinoallomurus purpureus TaxID=478114 RepID=UPI0020931E66|nr:hypothetical protein [Actinoallomurus purpureus]MCO6007433.1 hypothetical protein [Actinoallomurus purpureus]
MGGSELRAETARGAAYDAPSGTLLLRLLDELGPGNQYLIVDRLAEHYMQVYREIDGTFALEYREGAADRHFEAVAVDLWQVHEVLTAWAADAPGWREAFDWRHWPPEG